ncbi:hypothetical protein SteCoe_28438 [Stentor coeruleus]|uniref:Cyclic nucleotide-binding domain-containing protein n=1 Tax=Stentor coeruleus TaxID=5963 RepID=A0A1R2B8B9_9CILI|nr:hypothetical protein SteCoe_28438 [Stentor coeruleus]
MQDNIEMKEIIQILKIPSKFRLHHQHETLVNYTKDVAFFSKIAAEHNSSEIHKECCSVMLLEEYEEGDLIINYGEIGEKFYILLYGSVSIMLPIKKKIKLTVSELKRYQTLIDAHDDDQMSGDESSSIFETEYPENYDKIYRREGMAIYDSDIHKKLMKKGTNYEKILNINLEPENADEKAIIEFIQEKYGKNKYNLVEMLRETDKNYIEIEMDQLEEIGILNSGESFGELALISDKPRAASIKAKEHTKLLVLHKDDFKQILGSLAERQLMIKVRFLQSLPYFFSWTKSLLVKLAYFFTPISIRYKQKLFREGEITDGIYFIKEGEFVLSKKCEMQNDASSQYRSDSNLIRFKKPNIPRLTRLLNVIIKGKNEAVGGYEVVEKILYREYSCTCTSTKAEVYYVQKEHLLTKFPHIESIRSMLKDSNKRLTERYQRVSMNEELKTITENSCRASVKRTPKLSCHDLGALSSRRNISVSSKKEIPTNSTLNVRIRSLFAYPSTFMKKCRINRANAK